MAFLDEGGLRRFYAGLKGKINKKAETFEMTLVLAAEGWTDEGSYAVQTVAATGLKKADTPFVCPDMSGKSAAGAENVLKQWHRVNRMTCSENTLTAYCCGKNVPDENIVIKVKVVR